MFWEISINWLKNQFHKSLTHFEISVVFINWQKYCLNSEIKFHLRISFYADRTSSVIFSFCLLKLHDFCLFKMNWKQYAYHYVRSRGKYKTH